MKKFGLKIGGNVYSVRVKSLEDSKAIVDVNGTVFEVELERDVVIPKTPKLVRSAAIATPPKSMAPASGVRKVTAPLPGIICKVHVREDTVVKVGDVLCTLEAMKMENNILAEKAGTVKTIRIKENDAVLQGDVMMEIE